MLPECHEACNPGYARRLYFHAMQTKHHWPAIHRPVGSVELFPELSVICVGTFHRVTKTVIQFLRIPTARFITPSIVGLG